MTDEYTNFEEQLAKLDKIIGEIDGGADLALTIKLYEEAIDLAADVSRHLEEVRGQVNMLKDKQEGLVKISYPKFDDDDFDDDIE